jgi:hypothetical protein
MHFPFLVPMYGGPISIFGLPPGLVELVIGVTGGVAGYTWLRRIGGIEPPARAFRAANPTTPGAHRLAVAVAVSGGVLIALLLLAWSLRPA